VVTWSLPGSVSDVVSGALDPVQGDIHDEAELVFLVQAKEVDILHVLNNSS
jgi:hypothetical protein